MESFDGTLLVLLLILSLGLIVPELFRKFRLPFVTSLILIGALLGPNGISVIEINPTVEFFGFLGLTFLMLMAGLETKVEQIKHDVGKILFMAFANGMIPAIVGFGVTRFFGYDLLSSLLVAVIFISSSVAIIIPSIKSAKLFKTKDGQLIVSSVVLEDVLSLFLLAFLLQSVAPTTSMPFWLYLIVLVVSIIALKILLPIVSRFVIKGGRWFNHREHEDHVRFVIVLLMAVLLYFSALGVHPIIAAFLVGLLLASAIKSDRIYTKIHTLGYGLFVPVFFFIIGMQMDLSIFTSSGAASFFLISIVLASILSKYFSGYFAGRIVGIAKKHAHIFGIASTTQLTTSLAASQVAFSAGFIDQTLLTSMVLLSIITTIFAPIVLKLIESK